MNFDVEAVVKQMLGAAAGPLKKYWKTAEPIAKAEFTKIATLVVQIGVERSTSTITAQDAADRIGMASDSTKAALAMQAGLAEIAAEDAVNAAMNSITSLVNGYLGLLVL